MLYKSIVLGGCFLIVGWTSAFAYDTHGLRGKRFCEVIITSSSHKVDIYNTLYLNDCPDSEWNKITVNEIKKETGALHVVLNGPRKFCVDGAKNKEFIDTTPRIFRTIATRKTGQLAITLRETLHGSKPFHEHHVERPTTWVFAAGSRVYELIAPDGTVYVMQSFALTPGIQSERDLEHLNKYLKLPRGWQLKTGVLQKPHDLPAIQSKAIVIQDNLKNTYQRAAQDFLT